MRRSLINLVFGISLFPALVFAEPTATWIDTSFPKGENVNLIAYYHGYFYTSGNNESGKGVSWEYFDNKWKLIYQANDDSVIVDTTIVADKFYVAGNYPGKGSWVIEYIADKHKPQDLKFNFASHISRIENLRDILFVSGSDYNDRGAVWVSSKPKRWVKISPKGYNYISEMTVAPNELLYAAAIDSKTSKAKILEYSDITKKWHDTYLPREIVTIWSLISDKNNIIYAGGLDNNYRAQVWKYDHHKWISLKLDTAQSLSSLIVDKNGNLFAAGKDDKFHGQVWRYVDGKWETLNFPPCDNVNSLTINNESQLFATSKDNKNYSKVWKFILP